MQPKTFIKITNKDIYEKLEGIDKKINKINGRVRAHTLAISIIIIILVAVISRII